MEMRLAKTGIGFFAITMLSAYGIAFGLPCCDGTVPEDAPPPCKDPYSTCEDRFTQGACADGEYPYYIPKECENPGNAGNVRCGNCGVNELCYTQNDCVWMGPEGIPKCQGAEANALFYSAGKCNIACEVCGG